MVDRKARPARLAFAQLAEPRADPRGPSWVAGLTRVGGVAAQTLGRRLPALGPHAALRVDDAVAVAAVLGIGCAAGAAAGVELFWLAHPTGPASWNRWAAGFLLAAAAVLVARVLPRRWRKRGLRVVCISDTHGKHRELTVPDGDVLIHAGDYTKFGRLDDVVDFNDWLGTLPHRWKIVVNGNHEQNADWQPYARDYLTNAQLLREEIVEVAGLRIFGSDFHWPVKGTAPFWEAAPQAAEVVVAHGPAKGFVDGAAGCGALLRYVARARPRLVVSGHIHHAHGRAWGIGTLRGVEFVNAANCGEGYALGWGAVVVDL